MFLLNIFIYSLYYFFFRAYVLNNQYVKYCLNFDEMIFRLIFTCIGFDQGLSADLSILIMAKKAERLYLRLFLIILDDLQSEISNNK